MSILLPAGFTQTPTRLAPKLPVHSMKTYALVQPLRTHFREATCAEVECAGWRLGWNTVCDTNTALGRRQANYIRMKSGRAFTVQSTLNSPLVTFRFPPGQRCFTSPHHVPVWREPLYVVRSGDWRGNPDRWRMRHTRPAHWVDDFATHQDKLATVQSRG